MQVVADVVEATLAAAFLSGGHEPALRVARTLQIPIPGVAQWSDYARITARHNAQTQVETAPFVPPPTTVEAIERIFGAKFGRLEILSQGLVSHQSLSFIETETHQHRPMLPSSLLRGA